MENERVVTGLLFFMFFAELWKGVLNTAQKIKFSINDFFSKCDQIRRKLRNYAETFQCNERPNVLRKIFIEIS